MNKFTCPICKCHKGFKLTADYGAGGLWCKTCGVNYGNPKELFPGLPPGLIDLVGVWEGFWEEYADEDTKYNYEYLHGLYFRAGEYLAELINEFYPCVFVDY